MTFRLGPILSLLLGAAVLVAGASLFLRNSRTTDVSPTSSGPVAQAYSVQAEQDFRSAATATQAYFADNGSYDGMTAEALRAGYDAAFPNDVVVAAASGSAYCLEVALGTETYNQRGPAAPVAPGTC